MPMFEPVAFVHFHLFLHSHLQKAFSHTYAKISAYLFLFY